MTLVLRALLGLCLFVCFVIAIVLVVFCRTIQNAYLFLNKLPLNPVLDELDWDNWLREVDDVWLWVQYGQGPRPSGK